MRMSGVSITSRGLAHEPEPLVSVFPTSGQGECHREAGRGLATDRLRCYRRPCARDREIVVCIAEGGAC